MKKPATARGGEAVRKPGGVVSEDDLVQRGRELARELGPSFRRLKQLWGQAKGALEQQRSVGAADASPEGVVLILERMLGRATINVEAAWVELSDSLSPRQLRRLVRRAAKERAGSRRGANP